MLSNALVVQESLALYKVPFRNDRIVYQDGYGRKIALSEVLQLIFKQRITLSPKKQLHKGCGGYGTVAPGWVHLGYDKADLTSQKNTQFVRTYSTLLDYVHKGYEYMTFGTFHTKTRRAGDRKRQNLNSVHAFVIDIDSKKWSSDDILSMCSREGLVPPTFINETPRGYHVWFVLEHDIVGPHAKEDKLTTAGSFYNDVNRFLIETFQKAFPAADGGADALVGGERYIRIPRNLSYYSGMTYSINDFVQIRNELNVVPAKKRTFLAAVPNRSAAQTFIPNRALKEDPAYAKLLTMQPKYGQRRYTAFTIALLFYAIHMPIEEATVWLEAWYGRIEEKGGFTWREIQNAITSAYSGKHRGPYYKWMITLTGMQAKVFFTRRKAEDERIYKTNEHWEAELLSYLQQHGGSCTLSNRELCDAIGLSSRAMLEKVIDGLIERGLIRKEVVGRGRGAKTSYFVVPVASEQSDVQVADKIVWISSYRNSLAAEVSVSINDPQSYRNIIEFNREGGREGPS